MSESIQSEPVRFELPDVENNPGDTISFEGDKFKGSVSFYRLVDGVPQLCTEEFSVDKSAQPLSAFHYKKPVVEEGGDPFTPNESWEENERSGYYPLTIVRQGYRGPNHWHRADDALVCAVQNSEGVWETRYFPQQNIAAETWEEAKGLLGIKK